MHELLALTDRQRRCEARAQQRDNGRQHLRQCRWGRRRGRHLQRASECDTHVVRSVMCLHGCFEAKRSLIKKLARVVSAGYPCVVSS